MDYQMIVLDLDGTLTNRDKLITPKTKNALMNLQERGKKVVLASGRPTCGILTLAKELKLSEYGGYILSFNGGMIIDCRTDEIIFSSNLPVASNQKIIQLAMDEGVHILTYMDHKILADSAEDIYVRREAAINHMEVEQIDNLADYVTFPVVKFLMVDDGDYLAMVEPRVKAALGKNFSVYRSEPFFLEILTKGIDKAESLERLLQKLNLSREQLIACGDGYNDLSMIKYAGLGVAMKNAVLPVRKAADYITFSNDEDGIAHVIEKFM